MTTTQQQTSAVYTWRDLPNDVWKQVFTHCKPELAQAPATPAWLSNPDSHSWFLSLRGICRKFHSVFAQNQKLISTVRLHCQLDGHAMLSFLEWIRQNRAVDVLVAGCHSPWSEAALTALHVHRVCLTTVHVKRPSEHAILVLCTFQHVTELHIVAPVTTPAGPAFSLKALQGMLRLRKLVLAQGNFSHVDAPRHLTNLVVEQSSASFCQPFAGVASLVKMSVLASHLHNFYELGLYACTALQTLAFRSGHVLAPGGDQKSNFSSFPVQVSQNVSALTALTALTFCFGYQPCHSSFDWLGHITQLRFLQLSNECQSSHSDVYLPGNFSTLEKLTVSSHPKLGSSRCT